MSPQETKERLLQSDAYVMEELRRLQRLFELKHITRFNEQRTADNTAESVAEHVFGMHTLFNYFWPLEDLSSLWDEAKMRSMITFHDIEEVITGDTIGYRKTAADKEAGAAALTQILTEIPASLASTITAHLHEYEARKTIEAQFVKAIDKIEPVVHICTPAGKTILQREKTTVSQHHSIKLPYFEPFPVIRRFYDVVITHMEREGFFTSEA